VGRPVKAEGWKAVLERHPEGEGSVDPAFWEDVLTSRPDVLHRLLADVHRMTYGTERPPTLDELWEAVAQPSFSNGAFPEAFAAALGNRSVAQVATRAGMDRKTLHRFVTAERPIVSTQDPAGSMHRIQVVAKALGVHPSYFSEWRRLWVMSLIDVAFGTRPELSVSVYRRFSAVRVNGRSEAS